MGSKPSIVKKTDIQSITRCLELVRTLPRRVTITTKSLTGRLWSGKFEAKITTLTVESDDERD